MIIGFRIKGGEFITESVFSPEKLNCKDLGIGVAERYNISKSKEKLAIFSFCLTPNLCSSSTITNPTLLKDIDSDNRACVPIIISVVPLLIDFIIYFFHSQFVI